MKKGNFYIVVSIYFIIMNLGCYAKNIDIKFAKIWYSTDLTPKGTTEITDKSRVSSLRNRETPKQPSWRELGLPKNKFLGNNLVTDNRNLYILNSDGFIYRVEGKNISQRAVNKKAMSLIYKKNRELFHKFISIVDNHILYSTMREKEINCDAFEHHYRLYALDLSTGTEKFLAEKMQPYYTVGGCYNPMEIFPPEPKKEVWRPLKENTKYSSSDYNLREDVAYFELRKYVFDNRGEKQLSDKYIPYFIIYRKKLSSFPQKIVKSFRRVPFNNKQSTDIEVSGDYANIKFKAKGFIIKTDNRFWTINEEKDFLWLFDKLDTEAELYYFLKINNLSDKYGVRINNSYKKTALGYDVKQERMEHKVDIKPLKGIYEEHTSYDIDTVYIYHINSNKTFTKELISKTRKNEKKYINDTTMQGDCYLPPILPKVNINSFLKQKEFVTPQ